jgi:uncharacterized membrane protein YphA (DoxX/SURF4 family)
VSPASQASVLATTSDDVKGTRAAAIGYWVTTALVALVMLSGGLFQVMKQEGAVAGITRLGYPLYVVIMLGVWKVLGGLALLAPRTPRLKEWAYAGIVFDLVGAAVSQGASGMGAGHVVWPLALLLLALASWALRPESRRFVAPGAQRATRQRRT